MQQVKVAGALSGLVTLPTPATLGQLRAECARLLVGGLEASGCGLKLIVAGKTLLDDSKGLAECGVGPSTRVLIVRGSSTAPGADQVVAQEAKQAQLDKLKVVMGGFADRDKEREDGFTLELENQDGASMKLGAQDRRALVMGLGLHQMAKAAMAKGDWAGALERLLMGEEALGLSDPTLLEKVDNLGMLLLDSVWCCYKLRDERRLAVAKERLGRVRAALMQAYGKNVERLRALHYNSRCPELALFTRLEALEAVAAFHAGDYTAARAALHSAQLKWNSLQVQDGALAAMQGMGYECEEAKRALRFNSNDLDAAVAFISQQRMQAEDRRTAQRKEWAWHEERQRYGHVPGGQYLEQQALERVASLGYPRPLAALALRLASNDVNAALDDLVDVRMRGMLSHLLAVMSQHMGTDAAEGGSQGVGASQGSQSISNEQRKDRKRTKVVREELLSANCATQLGALLASARTPAPASTLAWLAPMAGQAPHSGQQQELDEALLMVNLQSAVEDMVANRLGREGAASAARRQHRAAGVGGGPGPSGVGAGRGESQGTGLSGEGVEAEGGEEESEEEGRQRPDSDKELEREVRDALAGDALSSYDLEVLQEGELIATYAALLASQQG